MCSVRFGCVTLTVTLEYYSGGECVYRLTLLTRLSFSFGRALQASCLAAWSGRDVAGGQAELLRRAEINGAAALGQYGGGAGGAAGQQSNFVQKHTY